LPTKRPACGSDSDQVRSEAKLKSRTTAKSRLGQAKESDATSCPEGMNERNALSARKRVEQEVMMQTLSFIMIENDSEYSLNALGTLVQNTIAAVSQAPSALVLFAERAAGNVDFDFRLQLALCARAREGGYKQSLEGIGELTEGSRVNIVS
jgi:hypothetical protein